MEKHVTNNIRIEGAKLIYRNFQGKGSQFNKEGNRTFGVLLDDELAKRLIDDGWRVKFRKPREDDPDQYEQPWMEVKVRFEPYPPVVVLINSKGKKKLDEETVGQIDWSRIIDCDLIIRPYNYPALQGRPAGVSAYLKAMYVTIEEDEFYKKYENIPDLDDPRESLPFENEEE